MPTVALPRAHGSFSSPGIRWLQRGAISLRVSSWLRSLFSLSLARRAPSGKGCAYLRDVAGPLLLLKPRRRVRVHGPEEASWV